MSFAGSQAMQESNLKYLFIIILYFNKIFIILLLNILCFLEAYKNIILLAVKYFFSVKKRI